MMVLAITLAFFLILTFFRPPNDVHSSDGTLHITKEKTPKLIRYIAIFAIMLQLITKPDNRFEAL